MLKRIVSLVILSLLTTAAALPASARPFDIELIIFKRNNPQPSPEYWDQSQQQLKIAPKHWLLSPLLNCQGPNCLKNSSIPSIPSLINGSDWPKLAPVQVQVLPSSQFKLNAQWQRLASSSRYTPMLHMAWRQNIHSPNRAAYLGVIAGKHLDPNLVNPVEGPFWELQGGIKISLQHYLYIDSKLLLTEPNPAARQSNPAPGVNNLDNGMATTNAGQVPTPQPALLSYKFDQKRRVRSGEIHYFDHPKFGVIIQIRKIANQN
ncbi:peptidoglycan binding protein CsiV [Celerinatantimonas sp. MCCC 1A17872]|uniref:peptidoglycan binding protein CsiV n=1 Tax=Celerinatantimonas sp. MCCC 1A17872 TaxID=3177514 RepID=UPI0038C93955